MDSTYLSRTLAFVEKVLKERGIEVTWIRRGPIGDEGWMRLSLFVRSPEWSHLKKYKGFDGCPKCGGFMIVSDATYGYDYRGMAVEMRSLRWCCGLCGTVLPIKSMSVHGDTGIIEIEMEKPVVVVDDDGTSD